MGAGQAAVASTTQCELDTEHREGASGGAAVQGVSGRDGGGAGWALVQTGRRAGQGSVPEGSRFTEPLEGLPGSARGQLCFQGLATAVEGVVRPGRLGTWGHGGAVEEVETERRTAEASDAPVSGTRAPGGFMGAVGCSGLALRRPRVSSPCNDTGCRSALFKPVLLGNPSLHLFSFPLHSKFVYFQ